MANKWSASVRVRRTSTCAIRARLCAVSSGIRCQRVLLSVMFLLAAPIHIHMPGTPSNRHGGRHCPGTMRLSSAPGNRQYVPRPPEMSNTAPVLKEQSSDDSQHTMAAISSTPTKRAMGILDNI